MDPEHIDDSGQSDPPDLLLESDAPLQRWRVAPSDPSRLEAIWSEQSLDADQPAADWLGPLRAPRQLRVLVIHLSENRRMVEQLVKQLRVEGWDAFYDADFRLGRSISHLIAEAIDRADAVIAVICPLINDEDRGAYLRAETRRAMRQRKLIPARVGIRANKLPVPLADINAADITAWAMDGDEAGLDRLIEELRKREQELREVFVDLERLGQ